MSVWKKFQRVGKKAAKYQFTASYTELTLETISFQPENVVITWMHRNRRYSSEPVKMVATKSSLNCYSHVWNVPENVEIVTTIYKMKKDVTFEDKDWTFQLEDVRDDGSRRRVLAYRNINIAQYAEAFPTQNNIKISFKISSKKVKAATLFLTLSSMFLKEGEATDDDMISVASLMSLPSHQRIGSFSVHMGGQQYRQNQQKLRDRDNNDSNSDIANLDDLRDCSLTEELTNEEEDVSGQISQLCGQIGRLDTDQDVLQNRDLEEDRTQPNTFTISPSNSLTNQLSSSPTPTKSTASISNQNQPPKAEQTADTTLTDISGESSYDTGTKNSSTTDLLQWCQKVTQAYDNVTITNFTTSFRNGLAFCAIIHHFHPELITDIRSLSAADVKTNNSLAFNTAASLGIPKVMDSSEMAILKVPDPLSVMTYLHQLRSHFTGRDMVLTPASIGNCSPGSYIRQPLVAPGDAGATDRTHFPELFDSKTPTPSTAAAPTTDTSLDAASDNKATSNHKSQDISIGNPFETTSPETKKKNGSKSPSPEKKSSLKLVLPKPKKHKMKLASFNVDGTIKEECSMSEKKLKKVSVGKINMFTNSEAPEISSVTANSNNIDGQSNLLLPLSPGGPASYISAEVADLEREQDKIDEQASQLERQLRSVLNPGQPPTPSQANRESVLLAQWFELVNKKNALIRRNMQLQILEKEQNLEQKWNLLQNELRQILSIEDWNKSEDMKRREELLMKDLIDIINQRDKVVHDLDKYEKGIEADTEWAQNHPEMLATDSRNHLANAKFSDHNCIVM